MRYIGWFCLLFGLIGCAKILTDITGFDFNTVNKDNVLVLFGLVILWIFKREI